MALPEQPRKYTLQQYRKMAIKFNSLNFEDKLKVLKDNPDILTLANDGNWWGVLVIDEEIQEELFENDEQFDIENEWQASEMESMVCLLGISLTGL